MKEHLDLVTRLAHLSLYRHPKSDAESVLNYFIRRARASRKELKDFKKCMLAIGDAHDKLSARAEDPEGSNDAEHDASVQLMMKLHPLYAMLPDWIDTPNKFDR